MQKEKHKIVRTSSVIPALATLFARFAQKRLQSAPYKHSPLRLTFSHLTYKNSARVLFNLITRFACEKVTA